MAVSAGPRSVALVGPYLSGKTTLLESVLFATEKVSRKGKTGDGTTVGDHAQEARDRGMGIEVKVATTSYLGDTLTILDCPGSIEFAQEAYNALIGVDAAVIVADAQRPGLGSEIRRFGQGEAEFVGCDRQIILAVQIGRARDVTGKITVLIALDPIFQLRVRN